VVLGLLFAALGAQGQETTEAPRIHDFGNPENRVQVMSFNIRYGLADDGDDSWGKRTDLVAEVIAQISPDLLGVQECLKFQAGFLKEELPGHGFFGAGRDDGAEQGEMCAVFWRESLFEKLDGGHFWLSPEPDRIGSVGWDAALTRMATWVILRTRDENPTTFVFANTHFDHMGQEARFQSARVIHEQLNRIANGLPVVLTGDFNSPADPAAKGPYHFLVRTRGWQDSYRQVREPALDEGTFCAFRGETSGPRIDWILLRGPIRVHEGKIIRFNREGRYPSDHFPVSAVIDLKSGF
jgi:endonuclease/exonuclease/phosphatase family metal-dependent hydrolase